jgi:hypothetical protein
MAEIGVVLLDIQKIPNKLGAVVDEAIRRPGRDEIRARISLTAAGAGRVVRDSNLVIDDFRAAHA